MKFIKDRNKIVNESNEISKKDRSWVSRYVVGGYINEDGEIETLNGIVNLKNNSTITHFPIKFANCIEFNISFCENLKNLYNSPDVVRHFAASNCRSLIDLKGISKDILEVLRLSFSTNIRSFDGLSKLPPIVSALDLAYPKEVLISCWEKGITPDELENFKSDWEI
jgi:hypothetical protein